MVLFEVNLAANKHSNAILPFKWPHCQIHGAADYVGRDLAKLQRVFSPSFGIPQLVTLGRLIAT